jgi:hypothetical protein
MNKYYLMKSIVPIILLLLLGCNKEVSQPTNYKIFNCVVPNIPYGAPVVKTKFRVDIEGNIKEILITQSSGVKEIDDAALISISTCKIGDLKIKSDIWIDKNFTWSENIGRIN